VNTLDPELVKALKLVADYDSQRPNRLVELRLYYNDDGRIIGLWETDHPEGNYIVLDNADILFKNNTDCLRVVNGAVTVIVPKINVHTRLTKSISGQAVVRGHAALALTKDEQYTDVEYYDRKTNN
jgi:hypothetical protein